LKHFVIAVAVLSVLSCKADEPEPAPVVQQPAATTSTAAQTVDIKISGGEYQPASITVAKGQPVRLNFTRDEKPTCGDVVVFPALNIRKEIPVNQVVSVDLNPTEAGELKFTCGMDMMKGAVVVQ
jgi:plastocyanin domain-containing protein